MLLYIRRHHQIASTTFTIFLRTSGKREREREGTCKVKVITSRLGTQSLGREEREELGEVTTLRLRTILIITFRHRQHLYTTNSSNSNSKVGERAF